MAERTCSVVEDGKRCDRPHLALGWCEMHHGRWRRNGTTDLLPTPTLAERFWAKVDRNGPAPEFRPHLGSCWIWTARIARDGYGRFGIGGRLKIAHRVAYELEVGPIPEGLILDHLCRVRPCVRPSHLEPVTNRENVLRGIKGILTTHCPAGHPYDEANTYWSTNVRGNPSRNCRVCHRERQVKPKVVDGST